MAHYHRKEANSVSEFHHSNVDLDATASSKTKWSRTRRRMLKPVTWNMPFVPWRASEVREVGSFLPLRFGCFFNVEMQFDGEKMGYHHSNLFLHTFDQWQREVVDLLPWDTRVLTRFERQAAKTTRMRLVHKDLYHSLAVASCIGGSWHVMQGCVVPDEDLDCFWDISQKWWAAHAPEVSQLDGMTLSQVPKPLKDGGYARHLAIVTSLDELGRSTDHSPEDRLVWSTPFLTPSYRNRHVLPSMLKVGPSEYGFGWEMEEYVNRQGWNPAWIDRVLKSA